MEELAAYIAEKGYAFDARRRLVESGLKRLLPVLEQIVKNGKNRKESICNLAII